MISMRLSECFAGEIIGKLIVIMFCIYIIRLSFQSDLAFVLLDFLLYLLLFDFVSRLFWK